METSSTSPPQSDGRQGASTSIPSSGNGTQPTTLHISDRAALAAAWHSPHPILTHLNADTTWLLHIPYPEGVTRPPGRSRFNVLLDPWLQGPQSDGGRWFSIQWHVVAPSVQTIEELNKLLGELEEGIAAPGEAVEQGAETRDYIDVVAISHEFTDHCHEATLRELPVSTPVFAPDKAAKLIRSWKHFDNVIEMPAFLAAETKDWREALSCAPLPSWVGIGRVVTPGNALYYHAAVMVAWTRSTSEETANSGDAIIYSPHGIEPEGLSGMQVTGLRTLALLHGLDDVRIWMTKQLNLGAVNGVSAARESGAKYWIATHDEVKKGGGFVSLLLRRTTWSVADAVKKEGQKRIVKKAEDGKAVDGYEFVALGSGDGLVLA
ncbi:hypothetical protein FHL15_000416 [Xylaria flabelliformis]|uniref:Metallo-beta-lactamase domain-containing protein n=1 Tax=Xylaria flabelliformis TaxID=2512241 RepID=A0A553IFV4_9PEZI|nr:hypothetical protein FHL15_000416 [Xylaria flabelliformis]